MKLLSPIYPSNTLIIITHGFVSIEKEENSVKLPLLEVDFNIVPVLHLAADVVEFDHLLLPLLDVHVASDRGFTFLLVHLQELLDEMCLPHALVADK
jgi:hypothetical protein